MEVFAKKGAEEDVLGESEDHQAELPDVALKPLSSFRAKPVS